MALAVKCTAVIVKSRSFIDGYERIDFVVGILFVWLNGLQFIAGEEAAAQAVLDPASGKPEESGYCRHHSGNIQNSRVLNPFQCSAREPMALE